MFNKYNQQSTTQQICRASLYCTFQPIKICLNSTCMSVCQDRCGWCLREMLRLEEWEKDASLRGHIKKDWHPVAFCRLGEHGELWDMKECLHEFNSSKLAQALVTRFYRTVTYVALCLTLIQLLNRKKSSNVSLQLGELITNAGNFSFPLWESHYCLHNNSTFASSLRLRRLILFDIVTSLNRQHNSWFLQHCHLPGISWTLISSSLVRPETQSHRGRLSPQFTIRKVHESSACLGLLHINPFSCAGTCNTVLWDRCWLRLQLRCICWEPAEQLNRQILWWVDEKQVLGNAAVTSVHRNTTHTYQRVHTNAFEKETLHHWYETLWG